MKKSILALLIGVAFSISTRAQSNYKSGYVITTKGDTLNGFIDYREWKTTPKFIEFKQAASSRELTRFYPGMLQAFEVSGMDHYITYIGRVSADKNIFPDLPSNLDTTTVQDTLFLEVTYAGSPVSLLKQQDDVKIRYFIKEHNAAPVELPYHQYYVDGNNLGEQTPYRSILRAIAGKYRGGDIGIHKTVNRTEFTESDLYKAARLINNDQRIKAAGTYGSRFFVGLLFNRTVSQFNGINNISVAYPNGQNTYADSKPTSYFPRISGGIDFFPNRYTQKSYIRGELAFSTVSPHFLGNPDYRFKQYTISFTPQYLYSFYNKDNFKIFAGAGASFNYSFYTGNDRGTYNVYDLKSLWMNFPLQAGITLHKRIDVFAMYIPSGAYTEYHLFSISNTTYGIGLRYLFTPNH
ncbi:hypothetical protein KHS38_19285 [Mucilaginibacter sp. Bleaf8]|uniref:hypothetical protein n=1 Tax=Mucilaginibacter sp. Bleaf8 TaxID=2834430 RepID=UPI001BCCECB3|nr:hypothetical protein [Mucilaginibacter sp. Bleaf8]MBS7566557.1 hypothetical protein [Mucilaginibacter sp. Bleaf8]